MPTPFTLIKIVFFLQYNWHTSQNPLWSSLNLLHVNISCDMILTQCIYLYKLCESSRKHHHEDCVILFHMDLHKYWLGWGIYQIWQNWSNVRNICFRKVKLDSQTYSKDDIKLSLQKKKQTIMYRINIVWLYQICILIVEQ